MEEWKSLVKAEFCIEGKNINTDIITQLLEITPDESFNRNDKSVSFPISKKVGRWEISTKYEFSPDSCKPLRKLIRKLLPKTKELQQIKQKWNCDFVFSLVIEIYGSQCPSVYLNPKDIDFFHQIGAFYDVDIYYMGGYEEEDTYRG